MTDPRDEISAQAEAYLRDLQAATESAHERLRSGMMRLRPQAATAEPAEPEYEDEPMPDPARISADPIFATRSFSVPSAATGALVDFDAPLE